MGDAVDYWFLEVDMSTEARSTIACKAWMYR
ncbi:hypothetical protein ACSNOI_22240 [Actinomadura kijaniata]